MDNKPNLAPIDSHAESVRCDDDAFRSIHESFLNRFRSGDWQTRMIRGRFDTRAAQVAMDFLDILSRARIDDSERSPAR